MDETTRDINELLLLETFQGMNDLEIASIINFKMQEAQTEGFAQGYAQAQQEYSAQEMSAAQAAANHATALLAEIEAQSGINLPLIKVGE